ncbi:MAG: metal-dependent hydrolase [Betaproteobacteria bacterium]|nr:MAG: metal-dependent hydrolase [Betaproteobacteria bacterium]
MDPLSQGVLGAAVPRSVAPPEHARIAVLFGFLAGMAPDLDMFIRSGTDPLLFLEYHRQFTHALVFIPIGGFLCGWLLHQLLGKRRGVSLRRSVFYCTQGYASHGLLDACTTYGTQLFWPFSDVRFAWNAVSVVDPLFTLPILLLILLSLNRRYAVLAQIALFWAVAYPVIGMVQRDRAETIGWELAHARGHDPVHLEAKPSFANVVLWKIVYENDGQYYVDAVRVLADGKVYPGDSVPKLDLERDFPWLDHNSQQARDIERFRWFSDGYVALQPDHPNRITDIRYSMLPNQIAGLWSIEVSPEAGDADHVRYVVARRTSSELMDNFRAMLFE